MDKSFQLLINVDIFNDIKMILRYTYLVVLSKHPIEETKPNPIGILIPSFFQCLILSPLSLNQIGNSSTIIFFPTTLQADSIKHGLYCGYSSRRIPSNLYSKLGIPCCIISINSKTCSKLFLGLGIAWSKSSLNSSPAYKSCHMGFLYEVAISMLMKMENFILAWSQAWLNIIQQ